MRTFWQVSSLILFVLSCLTVVRAPTLLGWKLALLADEFGHFLSWATVVLVGAALVAIVREGSSPRLLLWACLSLTATVLFLRPTFAAWHIGRELRTNVRAAFPRKTETSERILPAFRFGELLRIRAANTSSYTTYQVPGARGETLPLDFYPAPNSSNQGAPCIVVVHGGGWNNGDRTQLAALNGWFVERGCAVAAVSYRLAPHDKWPAPAEDIKRSSDWLREHAAELKIDVRKMIILGRSAGGQIALDAAYRDAPGTWRGVISLYGPTDLIFGYESGRENDVLHSRQLLRNYLGGTPAEQPALYKDSSPLLRVNAQTPATLLVHGYLDTLVWYRHGVRLDAGLTEARVNHYFLLLPWATHAFDINLNGPGGQLTRAAIDQFINQVL